MQHLNAGANGLQIWEGYDSRYHHPARTLTWSMWGIYGINDTLNADVYAPRAHYYTFKQLFRFVKPGYRRIDISTSLSKMTVSAYYDPATGDIVITRKNNSDKEQKMQCVLKNPSGKKSLKYYYTNETYHFYRDADVKLKQQSFSVVIPPNAVFTLTGNHAGK